MYSNIKLKTYTLIFILFMYYILSDGLLENTYNKQLLFSKNNNSSSYMDEVEQSNQKRIQHKHVPIINIGGGTSSHSHNIVGAPVI